VIERRYDGVSISPKLVAGVWTTCGPLAEQARRTASFPEPPFQPDTGGFVRLPGPFAQTCWTRCALTRITVWWRCALTGCDQCVGAGDPRHGCGFNDDDLERMFERFYRARPPGSRSTGARQRPCLAIDAADRDHHAGRRRAWRHPPGRWGVWAGCCPKGI